MQSANRTHALRALALFTAVAGMLASVALVRGLFDPDYFWHLATGRLILETGQVPRTDPFSFTWYGQAWIPDQWLAQVIIAAGVDGLGPGPMIVAFGVVAAIGPGLVAAAALRAGRQPLLVAGVTALVAVALLPQVTIRPQVISFAMAGALLYLLIEARPEARHRLWVIPPLMLAWANMHGFFIVGLGIGFVYLVATLAGHTPMRPHRGLVLGIAAASLAATMLTPSGPGGLLYALSFADPGDLGARRISEWQSPDFHNAQFIGFLGLLGAMFLSGARATRGWLAVVGLAGALLGLWAARAVGVGSLMVMSMVLVKAEPGSESSPRAIPGGAPDASGERRRQAMELAIASVMALVLVAAAALGGPVTVDPRRAPVAATEVLRVAIPDARVLAAYEWGGYVISELYPTGGRVFVDGRMHKYQPQLLADYLVMVDAQPGWQGLLDRYDPDALLLYPSMLLARGPAADAGWCEAYRDGVAVLFLRDCSTASVALGEAAR